MAKTGTVTGKITAGTTIKTVAGKINGTSSGDGMGTIGNIGKEIIFKTSDKRILNFTNMQRTVKGRWASHSRVKKKPKKQFLGPDADSITFTIELNAMHGVKPRKTLNKIEKLIRTGKPQTVVIGNKRIGKHKFVITEMGESWETILNKGEVVKIVCDLTLEEYL